MTVCTIEQQGETLKILGVINFDTVPSLSKQGIALFDHRGELRFDFSEVSKADSSAIALLLNWIRYAKKVKKNLFFLNLPGQLLEIANVCEVMPFLEQYIPKNE